MKGVILGIVVCLAPALALADHDDWEDDHGYYDNSSKAKAERWERENYRNDLWLQAQRNYRDQQEEAERQKEMLKELREMNDNQRRMMGESVPPRFSLDD